MSRFPETAETMAVMGTLASGLAHAVRNPLNSIGLQLSLLERRTASLESACAAQMRDMTGIIREEILRLDALVGDFLVFSHPSRMQFRRADPAGLLDEVLRLVEPEAAAVGVRLERRAGVDPLPPASMDTEKIQQVLLNLLRNAIEAMPDGGVVAVEAEADGPRLCLRVRDTGPGLPEDVDVFALFVSAKPGGNGLGLPIARQIVLDHGGEIRADSRPGEGTTFTVHLPLSPPAAPAARG